jgi:uncharacterized oxidoreductase
MKLKGKTVLITGGASGLGLESAKQFIAAGANVIICGRDQTKLDCAKKLLPAVTVFKCDVSDAEQINKLYEQVIELGGIDILYNNAGVGTPPLNLANADEQHYKDAEYEMNINYLSVIRLNNLFMDLLRGRGDAAFINTTSVLSYLPAILAPTYSATKAALRFYTESLRKHLESTGSSLKVFELLPPLTETEMTERYNEKKMTSENVIKVLVNAIAKDRYTVRVGPTKFLYLMNRFFPTTAFKLLNQKKHYDLLK